MSADRLEVELLEFKCPHCGSSLSFEATRFGTAQECPFCFKVVVVPIPGSEEGKRLPLPITTARLRIRPLRTEDQPDWLEFVTDEESYKYLDGYAPDEDTARAWLARSHRIKLTDPNGYVPLGIELLEQTKLIGSLSFFLYASDNEAVHNRQGGFQMMIHPGFRCQGFASESLLALFNFGFTAVGLHDIRAGVDVRNIPARRAFEKSSMRLEGECTEDRYIKGKWVSTAWYRLLKSEHEHRSTIAIAGA